MTKLPKSLTRSWYIDITKKSGSGKWIWHKIYKKYHIDVASCDYKIWLLGYISSYNNTDYITSFNQICSKCFSLYSKKTQNKIILYFSVKKLKG